MSWQQLLQELRWHYDVDEIAIATHSAPKTIYTMCGRNAPKWMQQPVTVTPKRWDSKMVAHRLQNLAHRAGIDYR